MPPNDTLHRDMDQARQDIAVMKEELKDVREELKILPDIQTTLAALSAKLDTSNSKLDEVISWKNGGGEKPSLDVRIDRVERFQLLITWGLALVGSVILVSFAGALIYVIAQVLAKHPPGPM